MRELVYLLPFLLGILIASQSGAAPTSPADPSLSGTVPASAPLQARLETGDWWVTGEIPGTPTAEPALHGRLAAGHRAAQRFCEADSWCESLSLTVTPVLRLVLDAPNRGPVPAPQAGLGLTEELAWPFRPGLRLAATGGLGDRVGLDLPLRPEGGPELMLKLSAGIGAELDRLGGPPLDLRLAVNASATIAGPGTSSRPDDCSFQLQIAAKGGAPFEVSAPCGSRGKLSFGFRAAF